MIDREVTGWWPRGGRANEAPVYLNQRFRSASTSSQQRSTSSRKASRWAHVTASWASSSAINRLVVADNGVGVLVWLASGVGERMDRGRHPVGHHPVRGRAPNGWRPVRVSWWSPCGRQGCQRMVDEPLTDSTRRCQPSICPGRDAPAYCVLRLPTLISPPAW